MRESASGVCAFCMLMIRVYSASLYQNNRYGTEWFVLFGSAVCGLSAGLFWTVSVLPRSDQG